MKKIMIAMLFLVFGLSGAIVFAKQNQKDEIKATDIKIHKKQLISEEERTALDKSTKGKPSSEINNGAFKPLATGTLGNPIPEGGERYAIVIGLANYTGTVNDLCVAAAETDVANPTIFPTDDPRYYCQDKDAENMKTVLGLAGYANIVHLHDSQATRAGIMEAMMNLKNNANLDQKDEVVFFFSGHGVSGKYYGIIDKETVDEAIFTYDNNFIWDDELKQWANSLPVYRTVFAFDICLAGGMNDLAGANRVIAMSSGETQSSWTYTLGGSKASDGTIKYSEGLFSHYFAVDGMIGKLADKSNLMSKTDEKVAIEEAFSYTYPIIKIKQTPVLNDNFRNDLILGY